MNILITGANGFLGKTIYAELLTGNTVHTISRGNADIKIDLSIEVPYLTESYDLVVHCAGKAHVLPRNPEEKQAFFDVNVKGTSNLLKGIADTTILPKFFVLISSVSVYGLDTGVNINERTSLAAKDAYGRSKIEAEKLVLEWCKINNVICTILRLPLLAGPNPPGNLGAMIRGIKNRYYFNIGGGIARKSMVLTIDVAKIIPVAAKIGGIYNLTASENPTFSELSTAIAKQLGKSSPINLPFFIAKTMAIIGDVIGIKSPFNSEKLRKIVSDLTFDDSRAREKLNWAPSSVLEHLNIKD